MEKMTDIKAGYESYGNVWGGKIWLVKDMDRKRRGRKDFYCVLGLSPSGWWHLCYGTLKVTRLYTLYEEGHIPYEKYHKAYKAMMREVYPDDYVD